MNAIGTSLARIDGPAKVTGTAPYGTSIVAAPVFLYPITSTIARGSIVDIDSTAAERSDGVLAGAHTVECAAPGGHLGR